MAAQPETQPGGGEDGADGEESEHAEEHDGKQPPGVASAERIDVEGIEAEEPVVRGDLDETQTRNTTAT